MDRRFGGRADSCVAELLDTTFFGEGLYSSMQHAKENLLCSSPAMIVPRRGKLFVQAWGGSLMEKGASLDIALAACGLVAGHAELACLGPPSGSTIQLYPLARSGAAFPVSEAVVAFEVDLLSMAVKGVTAVSLSVQSSSEVTALVMFWESYSNVDEYEGERTGKSKAAPVPVMSTAVYDSQGLLQTPSADHWRQTVFCQRQAKDYSSKEKDSNQDRNSRTEIQVQCRHNEDDFWACVVPPALSGDRVTKRLKTTRLDDCDDRPICTCGLHSCSSIWRIMCLNSQQHTAFISFSRRLAAEHLNALSNCTATSEDSNKVFIVLGDSLLLAPAVLQPLLGTWNAATAEASMDDVRNCSNVAVIVACTSIVSMKYTQDLIRANFPRVFVDEHVTFTVLQCSSDEEVCSDISCGDKCDDCRRGTWTETFGDMVRQHVCQWAKRDSPVNRHSTVPNATTPQRPVSFVEPYFHTLQEEWGLEHFLMLCDFSRVLDSAMAPLQSIFSVDIVEIWSSFFSSQSLWDEYMEEIRIVEGIDMSAINELMVDVTSSCTEVTSSRLSQWGSGIFGSSCVASLSVDDIISRKESWQSPGTCLSFQCDTNSEAPVHVHGLAFWTVFKSSHDKSVCLSSDPNKHPEAMQAFRCFDKPYCAEKCHKGALRVNISTAICTDTNTFTVSVLDA